MGVVTAKRTWLDDRVDVLLEELDQLGLSMPRSAVEDLIRERVRSVATQMRTDAAARQYLTDEVVKTIAQTIALGLAEEAPGSDIVSDPRTAYVPVNDPLWDAESGRA